ncbi:hypothetical protein [Granulibacter bethesdensis]|uniref:hypothetical protein n=1 Tax=Granulibacter bethesdensis TaxID=364410 RepID=UPI0018DF5F15|nr:hypothetical protein [Granulibacter bethesdensis]
MTRITEMPNIGNDVQDTLLHDGASRVSVQPKATRNTLTVFTNAVIEAVRAMAV